MTYKPVFTHDKLRREVLADPEAKAIYEATKLKIKLVLALKAARKKKKLTQAQVAALMHTKKPVISRLESGTEDIQHFPSLLTIAKFAAAVGYKLELSLVPQRKKSPKLERKHLK